MITGQITSFQLPTKLVAGENINLKIAYKAYNPDKLSWKTAILAKIGEEIRVVSETSEFGHEGGSGTAGHDYNIGRMPGKSVTITVKLFGHNDAGYKWGTKDWR